MPAIRLTATILPVLNGIAIYVRHKIVMQGMLSLQLYIQEYSLFFL
ncbi:hypothetical protein AC00_2353 [Escherichia coli 1-250-04_S3_C1]|uniref:Uncharacterized protein n=1 Tax=Escherichia coli 1-250-04_S3_C1 TaxID=1444135 RepID=A0AAN4SXL0_ECOLX|nr:hypothetical protein AC00_2353 [Escherichia coli 1-250-04_S3_C1]